MKRIAALFLALALLLSGCSLFNIGPGQEPEPQPDPEPGEAAPEAPSRPALPSEPVSNADSLFSINYDPSASLNPLSGTNMFNADLFSLVYEGLFRLDSHFNAVPVLCEEWSTEDGLSYTFRLRPGVKLHDGSDLTAQDVVYSINQAAGRDKYRQRLSGIRAVNAPDELTVVIVLSNVNYRLPEKLDLPIIKSGTVAQSLPAGTGPYCPVEDASYLAAFTQYRDYDSLPIDRIWLRNIATAQLGMAFSNKTVDILNLDPIGSVSLSIHSDYELRYSNTSALIYLGFNTARHSGKDPLIRRAISRIVDRSLITDSIFSGYSTPAPLVLSPLLDSYDPAWEEGTDYSRDAFEALLVEDGVMDLNDDGFWDTSRLSDSLSYTIVVNEENKARVEAAEAIATRLMILGFRAEVRALPYADYAAALKNGSFDLYIAEVRLTGDFDLSPLLSSSGSLNYGRASGYDGLLRNFLATQGEEHIDAARALCEYAKEDAAIIPLAYKRNTVLTHMGAVSGLNPTQTGVFSGIAGWTIEP